MANLLVVDNYDSFTWNLVHLAGPLVDGIEVVRNDEVSVATIAAAEPDAILLSPGPCTPNEAGISLELVERLSDKIPIFGVCLGLQTIGQAFGGKVVRAPAPMHGKLSRVRHRSDGLFRGINDEFDATRYHSLVVERESCPDALEIVAESDEGLIMALSHRERPVHGVQFHPESILSQHGTRIFQNFLDLAEAWRLREPA